MNVATDSPHPRAVSTVLVSRVQFMRAAALVTCFLWGSAAFAADIPNDPALDPARKAMNALMKEAERSGLPTALLMAKVQEGLAKRIPADRIATALRSLNDQLGQAKAVMAKGGRVSAGVPLYRALAEAQMAGYAAADLKPLVKNDVAEATAVRAVQTATDLAVRGYPRIEALKLVQTMTDKDREGLPRVAAVVERLRREYALSPIDALGTLQRGLALNSSLDKAFDDASSDAAGKGSSAGRGRGQESGEGTPGNGFGIGAGKGKGKGGEKN